MAKILDKMIKREPQERYQTFTELADVIREYMTKGEKK